MAYDLNPIRKIYFIEMRIDPLNQGSQATFQNIPLNAKKIKHWRMATVIS